MAVQAKIVAPAPPLAVWERWADLGRWPEWNARCIAARLDGPLEPGARIALELVGRGERAFYTRPRLLVAAPGEELTWEARSLGLRAKTETRFEPDEDGTLVTLEADARGPMAFSYRLALPERDQALLFVEMLNALATTFR